jgi:hypothetical protein
MIFFRFFCLGGYFFEEGRYNLFEEVQDNMVVFKKFVSSFRTAPRFLPLPALIVELCVAHPRNNRFMTIEVILVKQGYSQMKYKFIKPFIC